MEEKTCEQIKEDIFNTLKMRYKLDILSDKKINKGYLNYKWKIYTDKGNFFVKQYNKKRYPDEMLDGLERFLNQHAYLYENGIPCPKLFIYEKKYVQYSIGGERFVLMELKNGNMIEAGSATIDQMYSLGSIIGKMHKLLNTKRQVDLPLHWEIPSKEQMMDNWLKRWDEAIKLKDEIVLPILEKQRKIIKRMHLEHFSQCEKGWAHWDLFVDNVLFTSNQVAAILDFDRMNYVFPEFDLSRAILSCCLKDNYLQLEPVSAYFEGYRDYCDITLQKLVRSIRLTWWKESSWIRAGKSVEKTLQRFCEENKWIGDNWNELEFIFSEINLLHH